MPEIRGSNNLLQEQQDSLSKVPNISLNRALDTRCEFSCPNFPSVKTVEDYQTAVTLTTGDARFIVPDQTTRSVNEQKRMRQIK